MNDNVDPPLNLGLANDLSLLCYLSADPKSKSISTPILILSAFSPAVDLQHAHSGPHRHPTNMTITDPRVCPCSKLDVALSQQQQTRCRNDVVYNYFIAIDIDNDAEFVAMGIATKSLMNIWAC